MAYKKPACVVPRQSVNLHWKPLPSCGAREQGVKLSASVGNEELKRGTVRELGNQTSSLIHLCSGECPHSCVEDLKILLRRRYSSWLGKLMWLSAVQLVRPQCFWKESWLSPCRNELSSRCLQSYRSKRAEYAATGSPGLQAFLLLFLVVVVVELCGNE